MFYNARWYDPSLSRFAQADSIVPDGVQGLDRYAYVNNSPVNFTDPTGHMMREDNGGGHCDIKCIEKNGGSGNSGGNDFSGIVSGTGEKGSSNTSILPLSLSGEEACGYVLSGASYICDVDVWNSFLTGNSPYSVPYMTKYSLQGIESAWNAYTPNALGISLNGTGGYGPLTGGAGLDGLYLFDDNAVASYLHGGPSPSLGGGLSGSASFIAGFNIDKRSDYEGASQTVELRLAGGWSGIRVGYFWPAFHAPFQPNDPQGFVIGPAAGLAASLSYSAHGYVDVMHYDFQK